MPYETRIHAFGTVDCLLRGLLRGCKSFFQNYPFGYNVLHHGCEAV